MYPQDTQNQLITPPAPPVRNWKKISAFGGLGVLVVGLLSGIGLLARQQLFNSQAWNCTKYTFSVSDTGTVIATNDSSTNEPLQRANVFINSAQVATFDVPALAVGQTVTIGTVDLPESGDILWEVRGTSDCANSGRIVGSAPKCVEIAAYDLSWNKLTQTQLNALSAGDVIRISVRGSAQAFSKAKFEINGVVQAETALKKPDEDAFYQEYTIPTGQTSFSIKAQLFSTSLNQWF